MGLDAQPRLDHPSPLRLARHRDAARATRLHPHQRSRRADPPRRALLRALVDPRRLDDRRRPAPARTSREVRAFLEWYAPYQFPNGKVPCCVDARGADPVPENDSHGELVYAIADYFRYTGDTAFLAKMWPHVTGAVAYMDTLARSDSRLNTRAAQSVPSTAFSRNPSATKATRPKRCTRSGTTCSGCAATRTRRSSRRCCITRTRRRTSPRSATPFARTSWRRIARAWRSNTSTSSPAPWSSATSMRRRRPSASRPWASSLAAGHRAAQNLRQVLGELHETSRTRRGVGDLHAVRASHSRHLRATR